MYFFEIISVTYSNLNVFQIEKSVFLFCFRSKRKGNYRRVGWTVDPEIEPNLDLDLNDDMKERENRAVVACNTGLE